MTVKEFIENEADKIIEDLQSFYGIQRDVKRKYINKPFSPKEEFIYNYECCLEDACEEISDVDIVPNVEQNRLEEEQKERISKEYDRIYEIRKRFEEKHKEDS